MANSLVESTEQAQLAMQGMGGSLPTAKESGVAPQSPGTGGLSIPRRGTHKRDCICATCLDAARRKLSTSGDSLPNAASIAETKAPPNVPSIPPIDSEAVKSGVAAVLNTLDEVIVGAIESSALAVTENAAFAAKAGQRVKLRESNAKMLSDMAAILAQKYNIAGQYAPEFFFAIGLIAWGGPVLLTVKELRQLRIAKQMLLAKQRQAPVESPKTVNSTKA